MTRGNAVCSMLAVLALGGLASSGARAEGAQANAAKKSAKGELGATAAALAQLIAERSLDSSLSSQQKAKLKELALKLEGGDLAGAKAGWAKFAKTSGLDAGALRAAARWVVREGLLEQDTDLAALADRARFHSEAVGRGRAGLLALRAAAAKASGGKPVTVTWVRLNSYTKFAPAVTETEIKASAADLKAKANELEVAVTKAEGDAEKSDRDIEKARDHNQTIRDAIQKLLDIVRELNVASQT